ncbi:MAG TPA: tetratricopeptide repeat protein, partial [Pyrinomonadaceae bacterium]|nr:tetratricopeptide repeat protein [Pyrinomonadaceae bacterium]
MQNRRPYIFLVSLVLVVFSGEVRAQGVGGTRGLPGSSGGIHTIQGRVYSPTGKPVTTALKVRLDSPNTGSIQTVTDQDGAFNFPRLEAGEYRITVEGGSEFENANEPASIYRESSPGGRIVRVDIFMRPKENFGSVQKDAVAAYKKAQELDKSGDGKKAIEQLNKALAIDPKFGPALNLLGVQYLKLGQPDKAAETLEQAVKIAPNDFLPRLNYGIALLNQKKFDLAEQELRTALSKNESAPTVHMYLGIALMNLKRLDEAEKELRVAVNSNSNEIAPAHRYLG